MAHLGGQLFSRHLVAVEVAGTLLLVALVGTVAIVRSRSRKRRTADGPLAWMKLALLRKLSGRRRAAVRHRPGRLLQPAQHDRDVPLGRDDAARRVVSLVAWGRYHNDWGGQMLVIFILTVAACEAAIALAVVLTLVPRSGSLDIAVWQQSARGQPAGLCRPRPGRRAARSPRPSGPTLTPAGIEPEHDLEEVTHRTHMCRR